LLCCIWVCVTSLGFNMTLPALRRFGGVGFRCLRQGHASAGACQASPLSRRRAFAGVASETAEPASAAQASSSSSKTTLIAALASSAVVVGGAGFAVSQGFFETEVDVEFQPVTEEVFDARDNLFVFFLDSAEELTERHNALQRIMRDLVREPSLKRVTFYYNVRKEGDPPLPDSGQEAEGSVKPIRVVMYKGQRKNILQVGDELPKQKVIDFYKPLSQDLAKTKAPEFVPMVSNSSFEKDVLKSTSPGRMTLVQMYEDTCFLCFLMRPFVNSVAALLADIKVPLAIKRLNIEQNDFPDDCPVARGTPTFVLFQGPGSAPPTKWEEFKPKEICEKLCQVFPDLSDDVVQRLDDLQTAVSRRFQLFTQLVMWTMELEKLEALVTASASGGAAPISKSEDSEFNTFVAKMMAKDMKRLDGMQENLEYLQKEVDEVEHDAALMGAMLGESVLRREKAESAARR